MGDRINFIFKQTNPPADNTDDFQGIVLYSHWGGEARYNDLKAALKLAEGYCHDESYSTRIMVQYLLNALPSQTMGGGLTVYSPFLGVRAYKEDHAPLIIDLKNKKVIDYSLDVAWAFENFINLDFTNNDIVSAEEQ
jgi:hypothetical protein